MSQITIVVSEAKNESETAKALSPVLAMSEEDIREAIKSGKKLIDAELFQQDYTEVAERIRRVVSVLDELGAPYTIHEFKDEIDRETLMTIMEDSNG